MLGVPPATLFAGVELASRVEAAERTLIEQCALAGPQRVGNRPSAVLSIGSGSAVWAAPDSPFNKVVGIGMASSFADDELDDVEALFADRGAVVQIELSSLAEPEVGERLTRRGFVLVGFENVLGLTLEHDRVAETAPRVTVRRVASDEFEIWLEIDVVASLTPDTRGIPAHEEFSGKVIEHAQRSLSSTTGFTAFLACVDGVPAGAGSLRVSDGIAQFCGASTMPEFRRRGVQASLLSARLAAAAAAECDVAVVTVQPGSTSQQNVQRHGFQLLYVRSILVRPLL